MSKRKVYEPGNPVPVDQDEVIGLGLLFFAVVCVLLASFLGVA